MSGQPIARPTVPQLHVVPNAGVITLTCPDPLRPGAIGSATCCVDECVPWRFRITGARVTGDFPRSWINHLTRQLPGIRWLLRGHDAIQRARATARLRIEHVAVGNFASMADKCAELPLVTAGASISVRVMNTGDQPLVARVLVEGTLS
jgi:hypothetical protein